MFPNRLVIATRNAGKVREILRICADWPVAWVTFEQATWPEVKETGATYLENALLKARAVARAVGEAALADDSGIEADFLGGGPGPRSARFAGEGATDAENIRALIAHIRATPPEARTARYRCVAAAVLRSGAEVWTEATCEGSLVIEPRGSDGFGYDPIFVPDQDERTMAQLTPHEKDAISHRGKAFRALGDRLRGT